MVNPIKRHESSFAIIVCYAMGVCFSWLTWPDVFVDFGRELYIPWQIAQGKVLYTDVAHLFGPLSVYYHGLLFGLFDEHLWIVFSSNLLLGLLMLFFVYQLVAGLAGHMTAVTACLVVIFVFAFGQYVGLASYNYVAPYSHELVHGLILGLFNLFCLSRLYLQNKTHHFMTVGGGVGLAFLTKPEVFLAVALTSILGLGAYAWEYHGSKKNLALLGGGSLAVALTPIAFFGAFLWAQGGIQAAQGLFFPLVSAFNTEVSNLPFYQATLGIDALGTNLFKMFWGSVLFFSLMAIATLLDWKITNKLSMGATLGAALVFFILGFVVLSHPEWDLIVRGWPLVLLILLGMLLSLARVSPLSPSQKIALLCGSFAFLLLLKTLFDTSVANYGFALAMPATVFCFSFFLGGVPQILRHFHRPSQFTRIMGLALVSVFVIKHLQVTQYWFDHKTNDIDTGTERFLADSRGPLIQGLIERIQKNTTPEQTLLVLPEGIMLNYLARRENPSPYINFMPPEIILFGESTILQSFKAKPADVIVVVHKDTTEYGYRFFGTDYAQRLYTFVKNNYRQVALMGAEPLTSSQFGVAIWRYSPRLQFTQAN